jgi:hypothetical protein
MSKLCTFAATTRGSAGHYRPASPITPQAAVREACDTVKRFTGDKYQQERASTRIVGLNSKFSSPREAA